MDGDLTNDTFYVTDDNGSRVDDPYDLANIEQVITVVLNAHFLKSSGAPRPADKDPTNLMPDGSKPKQKDLLYSLMDNYIKNDTLSVQNSIVNHVEYTLASRYRRRLRGVPGATPILDPPPSSGRRFVFSVSPRDRRSSRPRGP